LKFAQICSKQALKYTIFVNIQKRPKTHIISGKQFQKRPNGNPGFMTIGDTVSNLPSPPSKKPNKDYFLKFEGSKGRVVQAAHCCNKHNEFDRLA